MNNQSIRHESSLFFQRMEPLLKMDSEFQAFILCDLAKIARICSKADNMAGMRHLLAFLTAYAFIQQDTLKLEVAMDQWDTSMEIRQEYKEKTQAILRQLTHNQNISNISYLVLPSILNQLDKQDGGNRLQPTVDAFYRFAQVLTKIDDEVNKAETAALKRIWTMLHTYSKSNEYKTYFDPNNPAQSLSSKTDKKSSDDILNELNEMVGMKNVKQQVQTLTNLLNVQQLRAQRGMAKTPVSLHSVFCGPPGTGKTTVARMVAKIYKNLGCLQKGHLVETDRAGMVAGYVGQTAEKVEKLIESALDGVLFIDEAYALKPEGAADSDFGQEAIDILLKRMEDYRDRLVIIVAGYTNEMSQFIQSNPGLKSRFNRYIYFEDYTPDILLAIFERLSQTSHFRLTPEASAALHEFLTLRYERRDRSFGNGRLVRNLFEEILEIQANRLANEAVLTDDLLSTIVVDDVQKLVEKWRNRRTLTNIPNLQ
ncbi:MAG: AAA family ATPase [Cyanobacteria bacterium P01_F01_bin.150]